MTLILFGGALVVLFLTKRFLQPLLSKGKVAQVGDPVVWFIVGSCAIIAGWTFFQMWPGTWAITAIDWAISGLAAVGGWIFGTSAPPVRAVSALILLVLAAIVIWDIAKDRRPDGPAITAWFVTPAFLALAPGALFAAAFTSIYQQWQANGLTVLGWLGVA